MKGSGNQLRMIKLIREFITYHLPLITIIIVAILCGCTATSPYYRYETHLSELAKPPYLQILLTQHHNVKDANLTIDGGFRIYGYEPVRRNGFIGNQVLFEGQSLSDALVTTDLSGIAVGYIKLTQAYDVVVVPVRSLFIVGQSPYRGCLRIKAATHNKISLINIIDLETYLPGVVSNEMGQGYSPESLACQAIASRTYALYRAKDNNLSYHQQDYDLTDDVFSQVYRGEERTGQTIYDVVQQTRGVVLTYQGKIFNSVFHAVCGGHTESGYLIFGLPNIPPLSGHVCGFCAHAKYYRWQAMIPESEVISKLNLTDVSAIESINIAQRAPGGHALTIGIKLPDGVEILWQAQEVPHRLRPEPIKKYQFHRS